MTKNEGIEITEKMIQNGFWAMTFQGRVFIPPEWIQAKKREIEIKVANDFRPKNLGTDDWTMVKVCYGLSVIVLILGILGVI